MSQKTRKAIWPIAIATLFVCVLVAAFLFSGPNRAPLEQTRKMSEHPGTASFEQEQRESTAVVAFQDEPPVQIDEFDGLTPAEVLGNLECRQRVAASGDTTLVVLPSPRGARFSAVDGTGVLSFGEVPFDPGRYNVAKTRDGSVLVALGHPKWEEPGRPPPEHSMPVHVFLDGQAIFEHGHVLDFGVASDGSSFFVIEALAAETSRLAIHNLEQGSERHYDLGDLFQMHESGEISHGVWYSKDNREVMFSPVFDGIGTHHFFSVDPDRRVPRRIVVPAEAGVVYSTFASSRTGYFSFVDRANRDSFALVRRDIEWMPEGARTTQSWRRSMSRPGALDQGWDVSRDGSLLLMKGFDLQLIDTASGETVFRMPTVDREAQMTRLRDVLGPDAGLEVVGSNSGSRLVGEHLILYREVDSPEGPAHFAFDVFDLRGIELESGPSRRIQDLPGECAIGDSVVQGLQEHDGRLTFLSETS